MLMAVKNQLKVTLLSIKYGIIKEMLNKFTFFSNVFFMILNNSSMIVTWAVLFSIKSDIGGYTFKQVLLLWALSAGIYGIAHFFFQKAFKLSDTINKGKLDAYIVQPKNILLATITSEVQVSALGDVLFAFILYCIYGFTLKGFLLFILFSVTGGISLTCISVIFNSLSFWINSAENIAETENSFMINFSTYPDGIFKGITKLLLFTILPVGIVNYIPLHIFIEFDPCLLLINIVVSILLIILAFVIFYLGIERYSSSNLMSARI